MKERRNRSLFGKNIKRALAHEQPSLKSEDLPEYRRFFVDTGILSELNNNANQLIIGRRGTGKTHLLGAFHEMIRDESPDDMSLMLSIMELYRESNIPTNCSEDEYINIHAHDLFEDFLQKLFPLFLDQADKKLSNICKELPKKQATEKFNAVNNLLTKLLEIVELGSPVNFLKTSKKTIKTSENASKKGGASLSLGINKNIPILSAKASLGIDVSSLQEENQVVEIHSNMRVDIIKARQVILNIIDELNIDTLHILIDEWMELDKRTPSGIQPIFAQLLKKTFFNTNKISVKIASIWHQTTLYDKDHMSKSKGIELKHDILRAVDLDTAFLLSEDEVCDFCKELLFKRIVYLFEKIELQSDTGHISQLINEEEIIDDIFITELFDNALNFKSLITSSHGIPRDLMNLFHKCSLRIKRNFESYCICHSIIFKETKIAYNTDKRKSIRPGSNAQKLLIIINKHMESTGSRIFIVKSEFISTSDALQKLVDEELIHQLPSSTTPRTVRETHKCFLVDFGNYIDWVETKKKDIEVLLNESVLATFPTNFDSEYQLFEIDITQIENDIITCPECKKNFSKHEPVFLKASLCIHCAYNLQTI